jgi:hypothetical protein
LEIVTFVFPVFVSVTPRELLLPTSMLPKSRLLVLELSTGVDAVALPLREIVRGELGVSLVSEIDPEAFPAELGVNTALKVVF